MKKNDLYFALGTIAVILLFVLSSTAREVYESFNAKHFLWAGFFKFAILSTYGEVLALRIREGVYYKKDFGYLYRMLVWGILGVWIVMAMQIFSRGVPMLCDKILGLDGVVFKAMSLEASWYKLLGAFSASLLQNISFAPVFMLLHKVSDVHVGMHSGSLKAIVKPIAFTKILSELNWKVQWNFVFKKTLPLFWVPAHTITFMLPAEFQVLFAALLGVALGVILAVAANKK